MCGWLKLHRSLLEWEWYSDATTFRLFMHILLNANFKKSRFQGFDVPVGGFVSSVKSLAAETGLTNSQVRTSISKLERTKEIAINTTNKFSIISVVKWDEYQSDDNQIANKSQTDDKRMTNGSQQNKKERMKEGKETDDLFDEDQDGENEDGKSVEEKFAEWYQHYPSKVGRGQAEKAFKKAIALVDLETMIAATKAYAAKFNGKDKQFIKNPSTWLNGKCWLDDDLSVSDHPEDAAKARWGEAIDKWQKNGKHGPMPSKHDFGIE